MKNSIIIFTLFVLLVTSITPVSGNPEDINIGDVWEITNGASNVTVSVLDAGILWTGELKTENRWVNTDEVNGTEGVDDDNNGFIDDFYGYDMVDFDNDPSMARDVPINNQHGTYISNIIASSHENGNLSIAPGVKIQNVRILGENGNGFLDIMGDGIEYAMETGADIISLSLLTDSDLSSKVKRQILEAVEAGVLIVVPRYDYGKGFFEGLRALGVIAVSSSEYGPSEVQKVHPPFHVYAPSISVETYTRSGFKTTVSGISFAVPQVAATLALMLSANPSIPRNYLPYILRYSATDLDPTTDIIDAQLNVFNSVNNSKHFFEIDFDKDGILTGEELQIGSHPFKNGTQSTDEVTTEVTSTSDMTEISATTSTEPILSSSSSSVTTAAPFLSYPPLIEIILIKFWYKRKTRI